MFEGPKAALNVAYFLPFFFFEKSPRYMWWNTVNYHKTKKLRAVFNWVSYVIAFLLWFCITSLCDWLIKLAPLSQPIRCKTKTNRATSCLSRTRFPALGAGYMYLLWILIGSLPCLHQLWLARVITLVLVLRHSIENRSKVQLWDHNALFQSARDDNNIKSQDLKKEKCRIAVNFGLLGGLF